MTKRKFYKTVIEVTVLSEEPLDDEVNLPTLAHKTIEDDWVAMIETKSVKTLDGKQAADALYHAASEPGFFMLDENGEDE